MTPKANDTVRKESSQATLQTMLRERMLLAIRATLIATLEEEIEAFVAASFYKHEPQRRDHRNGYYARNLGTSLGEIEDLPVPRSRKGFRTQLFERYQRRQAELDGSILDMFVNGISTQKVGDTLGKLAGINPSPSTVSRVFHTLDGEFETWKKRPLKAHYLYVFADGTYFTVIYEGVGCKMPIIAVVGIDESGQREVLGFSVGERENQDAWEQLLEELKTRGVQTIDLWITDGNQAMLNAVQAKFSASKRQRCIKHKMDNILGYVPEKQQEQVRLELRSIFYQVNRQKAVEAAAAFQLKYESVYPTAIECMKRDWEACLTFYDFPEKHWKFIRTTNIIERLFGEVKKRTHKMAAAFRNEDSCLLMFYAIVRSLKFRKISIPASQPATPANLHNS
jgi:transposase-like protein